MRVKLTSYRGYLVLEVIEPLEEVSGVFEGDLGIGYRVINTKEHFGVSEEALLVLGEVPRCLDEVGDISWVSGDSGATFSWIGGTSRIIDPRAAFASRGTRIFRDECILIPNEVAREAREAIELFLMGEFSA